MAKIERESWREMGDFCESSVADEGQQG